MKKITQRLYILTGKGGVGKTSVAMALTKYLESQGVDALYNSFLQEPERDLWEKLKLPVLDLHLLSSAEIFIGRKLNSKTIASWIMKTHFFKSLFQMIPGLSHMILLGHIIDELEKNPNRVIVLDSPASGHALTMFESSSNFKKIFRAGMIVKDIERMHKFLTNPSHLKTTIVSLPTELSLNEARDLERELNNNESGMDFHLNFIINDSYLKYCEEKGVKLNELPAFLKSKVDLESEIIKSENVIPHIDDNSEEAIILKMIPFMEGLA